MTNCTHEVRPYELLQGSVYPVDPESGRCLLCMISEYQNGIQSMLDMLNNFSRRNILKRLYEELLKLEKVTALQQENDDE